MSSATADLWRPTKSARSAPRQHRREFFDPTVAKHGGRIFKVMGDGFLVEFGSVLNAARCAVEIQRGMPSAMPEFPKTGTSSSASASISATSSSMATISMATASTWRRGSRGWRGPGGIACSAVVRHQIGNKLEFEFLDQGEKTVKNIAQPVHVYFINLVRRSAQQCRFSLPRPGHHGLDRTSLQWRFFLSPT